MNRVVKTIRLIEKQVSRLNIPWVTKVSEKNDPYSVLVSCVLSLRTKDNVTSQASTRLFNVADNPSAMVKLSPKAIARLIYPVGFYRNKAKTIIGLSKKIINDFGGKVPSSFEELISIKGVGLKTANLVLGLGFGTPSICVDTHVHRISNRLGWVSTKRAEETEKALKDIIPRKYWIRLNTILVAFGQNICLPISPFCSKCYASYYCKKRGVIKHR